MDKMLQPLCTAIRKVISEIKPSENTLSFTLLTGRSKQGKTTLLRQAALELVSLSSEQDIDIELYYNQHGILLEIGDLWLNRSSHLLQHTLKQLNRCHHALRISGLILCVDLSDLLDVEPSQLASQCKLHAALLERFSNGLGYPIDASIIITKLDTLVGFGDFFQNEHQQALKEPLGFSLHLTKPQQSLIDFYQLKFSQFLHTLSQQVISKVHPARSSRKRSQIREFPLQFASLRTALKYLIQQMPTKYLRLTSIYFTSAEQGSLSIDRLHHKLHHEYALCTKEHHPQSTNFQAYFIEGAIKAFQKDTQCHLPNDKSIKTKWAVSGILACTIISTTWLIHQHITTNHLLDLARKDLDAYKNVQADYEQITKALFHLVSAANIIDSIPNQRLLLPTAKQLNQQLHQQITGKLQLSFLPMIRHDVEHALTSGQLSQTERYHALKVYLLLSQPHYHDEATILAWFKAYWKKQPLPDKSILEKKIKLLERALQQPRSPLPLNQTIVSDTRNFLNALPSNYFYYALAKNQLTQVQDKLEYPEFQLASDAAPLYFKKSNFQQTTSQLDQIAKQLQDENWVLARQDLKDLASILLRSYCHDYLRFWKHFTQHTYPRRVYQHGMAHELIQSAYRSNAFQRLAIFIQDQTSPELGENWQLFNQEIAHHFTELSLLSPSSLQDLNNALRELDTLLATLTAVQDQGKTAFTITKSRFQQDDRTNPLSRFYQQLSGLPEPVSFWVKQLAGDIWSTLLKDTQQYINTQWKQVVYQEYLDRIASRYPFAAPEKQDITIDSFEHFFAQQGTLNRFTEHYLKPFLDTSKPQWASKELNGYILPVSSEILNELIRANIITAMFFPEQGPKSHVSFSLEKVTLEPVVARLSINLGTEILNDTQSSTTTTHFHWPQSDASLKVKSVEGKRYVLEEFGPWAFFRLLQKTNVIIDENDSKHLQVLFDINGNSGRYLLKAENVINPFTPGILDDFHLPDSIA